MPAPIAAPFPALPPEMAPPMAPAPLHLALCPRSRSCSLTRHTPPSAIAAPILTPTNYFTMLLIPRHGCAGPNNEHDEDAERRPPEAYVVVR